MSVQEATKKVNMSLDADTVECLSMIAASNHKSISTVAKELILEALELKEDSYLGKLAVENINASDERISHEELWANVKAR